MDSSNFIKPDSPQLQQEETTARAVETNTRGEEKNKTQCLHDTHTCSGASSGNIEFKAEGCIMAFPYCVTHECTFTMPTRLEMQGGHKQPRISPPLESICLRSAAKRDQFEPFPLGYIKWASEVEKW